MNKNVLTKNLSRIYIIVVNNEIYKIGSSADKNGMRGTLNIYRDGGIKGRPSVRSFGVYKLMYDEIKKGNKIEFWMIYQNDITGSIKGLFNENKCSQIMISPKIIEEQCLLDYKSVSNNEYPIWNFQEQGKDWPDLIKMLHIDIIKDSGNRPKKQGRK